MSRLRFLPLTSLTVMTVLAATLGLRTPPPALSDAVVEIAAQFQYDVTPLPAETEQNLDDARRLVEVHGPSSRWPERVVRGVGLARVVDLGDPRPEHRLDGTFWIVVVDHVYSPCFGICPEGIWSDEPDSTLVVVAQPSDLAEVATTIGGVD